MSATDRTGLRPGPTRTCVGCRQTDSRSALLRVVVGRALDGSAALVPDPARRAEGRGASLHPTLDCLESAIRRRAFGRALRVSIALDPAPVTAYLTALHAGTTITTSTGSGSDADEHPMSTQQ